MTLRVDDDVSAFFRGLGPGHQSRMNNVLRAFMIAVEIEYLPVVATPKGGNGLKRRFLSSRASFAGKLIDVQNTSQPTRDKQSPNLLSDLPAGAPWKANSLVEP